MSSHNRMNIAFDNSYARLPATFFQRQTPTPVPNAALIRINTTLAAELNLDADWLASPDGVAMLSGNAVHPNSEPIAQAYAGHQFGGFSPQLGDGRAILLGEVINSDGHRRDIQLKGAGRTPFSRGGDGKSALGPVIREYILSEAMAALHVPTTRALAAISTGERVRRQEGLLPGGVFTRVASSHIRVGTFQYFLARNDLDSLRTLADYVINRHYPEALETNAPFVSLLESVATAQSKLIAQWMSLGFIHGVMNTDNFSVSGETIDFGPCAFMDNFHPQCVFSSIDSGARYAWGNQANIGLWNLSRFAETLLPLISNNPDTAIKLAEDTLKKYSSSFSEQYELRFRAKLGIPSNAPTQLISDCLSLLANQQVDFTIFFRNLTRDPNSVSALFLDQSTFEPWFNSWKNASTARQSMTHANPIFIPRNHRVQQAIQSAYNGDFSLFHRLTEALESPFTESTENADLELPPTPDEIVHETFCGT